MKDEGVKRMFKRALAVVFSFIFVAGIAGPSFDIINYAQSQESARAREVRTSPAAEVTVTLNEQFFNSLLDVIFARLKAPSFPLSITRAEPTKNRPAWNRWETPVANLSHTG